MTILLEKSNLNTRVLLGMSGGVDSSVAVLKLQEYDCEVVGVTFVFVSASEKKYEIPTFALEAAQLAKKLQIEHHIIDARQYFKHTVISNFIDEYLRGRTPFSCALCNKKVKWHLLYEWMKKLDCHKMATGHYAQIVEKSGKWFIHVHPHKNKDQSFFLWGIPQVILKKILFPLSHMHKTEVKQMAQGHNFKRIYEKGESFGNCFIANQDYAGFIIKNRSEKHPPVKPGNIVDERGKIVGRHPGIIYYTIGQRVVDNLYVGKDCYVKSINATKNKIVVAPKASVKSSVVYLNHYLLHEDSVLEVDELEIKFVYRGPLNSGRVFKDEGLLRCELKNPQPFVSPGQTAVFYKNNRVVGGGFIEFAK